MNYSLLGNEYFMLGTLSNPKRRISTPPHTPIQSPDGSEGDDNNLGHIIVYGENESELDEILRIPKMMADSIWNGMFRVSSFTNIDELENHLYRQVLQNPRLLVSITYLITKENVNRCLDSFLGFFEKVPGFTSSSDLQQTIKKIQQKLPPKMFADLYPEHSTSEEAIQSILLQRETKARIVRALLCAHKSETPLVLNTSMDPILDRLPDIGDIIRRKFSQPATLGAPVEAIIVEHMINFALFGDE